VPHNRFRPQGNHGTQGGGHTRGTHHLMKRGDRTIAGDLLSTGGTVHRLGGQILRAIEGQ
jgi:hypothetical protein